MPGLLCRLGSAFNVVNQVLMGGGYVSASLCEANGKRLFPPGGRVNTHTHHIHPQGRSMEGASRCGFSTCLGSTVPFLRIFLTVLPFLVVLMQV